LLHTSFTGCELQPIPTGETEMIKNIQVSEVRFRNEVVGFSVSAIVRDCSDSLWDPITHQAIFRTRERAERFLAKVCKTHSWDFKMANWNVGHSFNGCYSVI
jgi:hypothetical protein